MATEKDPSPGPFAAAGPTYFERGWSPFPLPPVAKYPPEVGYTGHDGLYASRADIQAWADNGKGSENIGLHFHDGQLGVDVDHYGKKHGGDTLAAKEAELGPLPPTFTATSRNDGVSGIRVFRVRSGRQWGGSLGPDVDIIASTYRYAVAPPSVHPEGRVYVWRDPDWKIVPGPRADEVPWLPDPWQDFLDQGALDDVTAKADMSSGEVGEYLDALPGGRPCGAMERVVTQAERALAGAASRHDTVLGFILTVVRKGDDGHAGARFALDTLESMYFGAFGAGDRRVPTAEWRRAVAGAVAKVRGNLPTDPVDRRCCDVVILEPAITQSDETAFWESRDVLRHIHTSAQAQMASPWAVLGVVMARCIAATPYTVVLPNTVFGWGSLNFFVALCGTSGSGKGGAIAVGREIINFGEIHTATIGSGEGIAHQYAKKTKEGVIRTNYECLMRVDEVDSMSALGMRQGSTLLPELRKAFMGEPLGFAYADPAKRLPVLEHQYRMGLIMGVQPGRARALLEDSDGGSPQRYVFLPTIDPTAPDVEPEAPEPIYWNRPTFIGKGGSDFGKCVISYPETVETAIKTERRDRNKGSESQFGGHSLFLRCKVTAALALLDGRTAIDDEDWELSGTIMAVSDSTRKGLESYLSDQLSEASERKAKGRAHEAVIVSETLEAQAQTRANRAVRHQMTDNWQTQGAIKRSLNSRDRDLLSDALVTLLEAGVIERQDNLDKPQYRLAQ